MDSQNNTLKCKSCGGVIEFDIKAQKIKCPYCETEYLPQNMDNQIKEYTFDVQKLSQESQSWNNETKVLQCKQCGAEFTVDKSTASTHCSYCGSSQIIESSDNAGIKPEAIATFKVDKNQAMEIFQKWIKGKFFAPNALKHLFQQEKLKPVYNPFWTYDANTFSTYTASGGEHYYVEVRDDSGQVRREQRTRWYRVSGRISRFFDDVLVNAGKTQSLSIEKIDKFNTSELKPFSSEYLSGFQAERYSVSPVDGFERAKSKMYSALEAQARGEVLSRYDEVSGLSLNTQYSDVTFKHVLLPLWMSGYVYQGKTYNFFINGQNGAIHGKYPLSPIKVTILVIFILLVAILIIWLLQTYNNGNEGSVLNTWAYLTNLPT